MATVSRPFCDTCKEVMRPRVIPGPRNLDLDHFTLLEKELYHPEDGAALGCPLCILFLSTLSQGQIEDMRRHNLENLTEQRLTQRKINECDVEMDPRLHNQKANQYVSVFKLYSLSSDFEAEDAKKMEKFRPWNLSLFLHYMDLNTRTFIYGTGLSLIPDGGTSATIPALENVGLSGDGWDWELPATWMRECKNEHSRCCQSAIEGRQMPSRLIHVGLENGTNLRLCESVPDNQLSATLSHCWGTHKPLTLVLSNLSQFKAEIVFDELPKTFQQAIEVARRLNIPYLWIDSLCIIQDSIEDSIRESSMMHTVYSGAVLFIAAAAANDSRDGLFFERGPTSVPAFRLNVDWHQYHGTYLVSDLSMWSTGVEESPLNRRAWVCQERVLSARTLYFTKKQIFWECREKTASEIFPAGIPPHPWHMSRNVKIFNTDAGLSPQSEPALDPYRLWSDIVSNYSNGALTYESDKLVAISAVARHLATFMGSNVQYLSGMWRRHLASQLVWRADHPTGHRSRPKEYRAPSWSWASIDGVVQYKCGVLGDDITLVRVHEAKTELVGIDPFGAVKGGFIRCSGRLARVIVVLTQRQNQVAATSKLMLFPDDDDSWDSERSSDNESIPGDSCWELKPTRGNMLIDCTFENNNPVLGIKDSLYFMPVQVHKRVIAEPSGTEGIVLEAVEGSKVFQRFGMYMIDEADETLFEKAYATFEPFAKTLGLETMEDEEGRRLYEVTIV